MRALVTGCAGFIGSHLTDRLLSSGYEVVGVDCFTDYYPRWIKEDNLEQAAGSDSFELIEGDLLKLELEEILKDVAYVFHQAAQAGVRKSWGQDFKIYVDNNILATQQILEACKELDLKKFVFASSSSVYGDAKLPMAEGSLLKPISPYGVTKLAAENLCYLYWKNYRVPTVSLRYFTVYGPRQRPDMAIHKFVRAVLDGSEITVFGDGTQTRDFTYIDDAVEANMLAAGSDIAGESFNIGGGSRITVNRLIELMEEITGRKANIRYAEKQKGDAADTWADISGAKEKLDWEPKTNIYKGLEKYLKWYRSCLKC